MFAAKITATSITCAPPFASVYLPAFSMLWSLTSMYATVTGPVFARGRRLSAASAGSAAPVAAAAVPTARADNRVLRFMS